MQYRSFVILFLAFSSCSAYAEGTTLPIFDTATIENERYYSGMYEVFQYKRSFKTEGKPQKSSTLAHSRALIIDLPEEIAKEVQTGLNTTAKEKYTWKLPKQCAQVIYNRWTVYLVITELNPTIPTKGEGNDKLIQFFATENPANESGFGLDSNKGKRTANGKYIAMSWQSDTLRNDDTRHDFQLNGIADIDGDGRHEIIIDAIAYAGDTLLVIKDYVDKVVQIELHGDSWD